MKKKWHIWLGITISVVLLYFFLRKIDFVKVGAILTHVDFSLVILAAAMQMAAQLLRAERWRVLVHPVKDIKLGRMFAITMIGMMSNNLFPARLGELIKAYLLGHQEGISKSTSLATVVVERLFDGLTIAVFMIAIILFFPFPRVDSSSSLNPRSLWTICLLSSFFYVGVLLLLLFIKKRQDLLKRFFQVTIEKILPKKAETFYNKLEDVIASFSEGLHFLHNKGVLLKITIQSIIMWLVIGLSFYLGFLAFGMKLSFFTAVLL
ncbi:MAG: lysylphosphatidylglycerol synthase transmembrane domain-containing protein, partial [bacterium]